MVDEEQDHPAGTSSKRLERGFGQVGCFPRQLSSSLLSPSVLWSSLAARYVEPDKVSVPFLLLRHNTPHLLH